MTFIKLDTGCNQSTSDRPGVRFWPGSGSQFWMGSGVEFSIGVGDLDQFQPQFLNHNKFNRSECFCKHSIAFGGLSGKHLRRPALRE